jgi:SAM-dependent methyltransferase
VGGVEVTMPHDERRAHWNAVHAGKGADELSWYQARPGVSLELIGRTGKGPGARCVDVGGGASRLVDCLLDAGYRHVTVLDVSTEALAMARARLGPRARSVAWVEADVTCWAPGGTFDVWHDRAVFHFLTDPADRAAYRKVMTTALAPGGAAIIGTFASDGPERCSGLPVARYEPGSLAVELGEGFRLLDAAHEEHLTPSGKVQRFQFSRFARV